MSRPLTSVAIPQETISPYIITPLMSASYFRDARRFYTDRSLIIDDGAHTKREIRSSRSWGRAISHDASPHSRPCLESKAPSDYFSPHGGRLGIEEVTISFAPSCRQRRLTPFLPCAISAVTPRPDIYGPDIEVGAAYGAAAEFSVLHACRFGIYPHYQ